METKTNIKLHGIQSTPSRLLLCGNHIICSTFMSQLVDRVYGNYNSHSLSAPQRGERRRGMGMDVGGGALAGNSCWSTRGV